MLLGKAVVQTKSNSAVEAQPIPRTVSTVRQLDADWMLRSRLRCYGNEDAGHLRAVSIPAETVFANDTLALASGNNVFLSAAGNLGEYSD